MILIKSFCIGNDKEAFFIDSFTNGINIIHSDDNNKGKTIVSQGIFYTLGNTPIFPAGFDNYQDYYYIVEIEKDSDVITICRKNNFFIVNDGEIKTFDSVNDFKRYFNSTLSRLPIVLNNGISQVVGLELFIEMVFLPQDERTTSNIFNKGRYTKEDYIEFLYSYMNCSKYIDPDVILGYHSQINKLEEERKVLKKSSALLKSKKLEASFATYTVSKIRIDEKMKQIEKCKDAIAELITTKNRYISKITKNELLLKEINSLNRELEIGKFTCVNCGSNRIAYEEKGSSVKFEITDNDTRNQIKSIISTRIQVAKEDIIDLETKLFAKQQELAALMKDDEVTMENLLFYKDKILDAATVDSKIHEIDLKIYDLKTKITAAEASTREEILSKEKVYNKFLEYMNEFYSIAEPDDLIVIDDIFTKKSINYSGSQGALFLMARVYAASKVMDLDFPIIIDDFRGGELSTIKESHVISLFERLNKQVILSCTLKEEEKAKYASINSVNDISFDRVPKFHLLNSADKTHLVLLLNKLAINLGIQ